MSNSRALRRQILAQRAKGLSGLALVTSVGLLGGYLGNPRLTRAYAAPAVCPSGSTPTPVVNETQLNAALINTSVDCIEIQGEIFLTSDLALLSDIHWTGSRLTNGLTIFGTDSSDAIEGQGYEGLSITLGSNQLDLSLNLSNFEMRNLVKPGSEGGALSLVMYGVNPAPGVKRLDLDISGMTFADNEAQNGGAVFVRASSSDGEAYSTVTISGSTFSGNSATTSGGAVYVSAETHNSSRTRDVRSEVDISSSVFSSNVAGSGRGGAVYATADYSSVLTTVTDSDFATNNSDSGGGALFVSGIYGQASMYIEATSTFTGNQVTNGRGGAAYAYAYGGAAAITSDSSTFESNSSSDGGGALAAYSYGTSGYLGEAAVYSTSSTFRLNQTNAYGGAIDAQTVRGSASPTVPVPKAYVKSDFSTFFGNEASDAGGAVAARSDDGDGYSRFEYVTLSENSSGVKGGAVYAKTSANVYYGSIVENAANGSAGAIYAGSDVYIENTYIGRNTADSDVGAVYAGGSVYLGFTTMYDNAVTDPASPEAIKAGGNIVPLGSAVGSSLGFGSGYLMSGSYSVNTSSYSISTSTSAGPYAVAFHFNETAGSFALDPLDETARAGSGGRTPRSGSPLVDDAPIGDLSTGIVDDQVGVLRGPTFTIGSRQFVASAAPTITSVTPSTGPSTGGTSVTINGTNLTGATSVTFGTTAAASFSVVNSTQVTAVTPSRSAGTVDVSVTTAGGTATSSNAFTFAGGGGGGGGGGGATANEEVPGSPSSPTSPVATSASSVPLPSTLKPGDSILLVDGRQVPGLVVRPNGSRNGLDALGPGFSMEVQGQTSRGVALPLTSSGVLLVQPGGKIVSRGTGFQAGSQATLFLDPAANAKSPGVAGRSTTLPLGSLQVDSTGSFGGSVPLPTGVKVGAHVLQVVGVVPGGSTRAVSVGIEVVESVGRVTISAKRSGRTVIVTGRVTGADASALSPSVQGVGKRKAARLARTSVIVRSDGTFSFRFKSANRVTVVVTAGDTRSNEVRVRALRRPHVSLSTPVTKMRSLN